MCDTQAYLIGALASRRISNTGGYPHTYTPKTHPPPDTNKQ